jgi:hypothetical protein
LGALLQLLLEAYHTHDVQFSLELLAQLLQPRSLIRQRGIQEVECSTIYLSVLLIQLSCCVDDHSDSP